MDHPNVCRQNTDRVGNKLCQRRCQALAVRARSDARLDLARRVHHELHRFPARCDRHAARGKSRAAITGALREAGESDSQKSPMRAGVTLARAELWQIDFSGGDLQRLDITALVEHQSSGRGVGKRTNEIAFADLDRTDAERRRGFVHQPFERKGDDRPRHATIGRHGAGMGCDRARAA